MSTTYRAAVIGCGGMGACHARAYKQVEQVELLAAVDPLAAARDQFRQNVGVPQSLQRPRRCWPPCSRTS